MKYNVSAIIIIVIIIIIILLIYFIYYLNLCRYCSCSFINNKNLTNLDRNYLKLPRVKSNRKVIISLTTIPPRINKLRGTLASLLIQSYRVDEIYINIPHTSLKGIKYKVPKWLSNLDNIKINWCERDYGPSTKLLPSLIKENKDTIIIIVDDDIIYGTKMVESHIYEFYRRKCKDALTIFGWSINKNLNIIRGVKTFPRYFGIKKVDLLAGYSSFLVTPEMFPPGIFDYSKAPKECIYVDDVWISGWLTVNKINIYSLGCNHNNISLSDINNAVFSNALSSTINATEHNNNVAIKWFHTVHGIWHK